MTPKLIVLALAAALPLAAQAGETLSREFKMPLVHAVFEKGDGEAGVQAYTQIFLATVSKSFGVSVRGDAELDKDRQVRFLDTPGSCSLRKAGFILRERQERRDVRLTLKTRSADEAWVRATRIDAPDAKTKLEEDINSPADGKLSRSATLKIVPRQLPATLVEAAELFPALKGFSAKGETLERVNGIDVRELKYDLPSWKVDGVKFESGLSIWRDPKNNRTLFVEIDFGYDVPNDPAKASELDAKAKAFFYAIQADKTWSGGASQGKTEWVYQGGSFCR